MTVPKAEYDVLLTHLEDTQASLAAALARVEAFRLKEKLLVAELAKLRLQGLQPSQDSPKTKHHASPNISSAGGKEQQPEKAAEPTSPPIPCYITEVEGHLPVLLVSGNRKVPGSVVVTQDFIDFVDIKARIKRHDFVGFAAAASGASRRSTTPSGTSWKQLIPCLSPTAHGPPSPDYGYSSQQQQPFSSNARVGGNGSGSPILPYSSSPNLGGGGSDKSWGAGLLDRPASLGPTGSPVSPRMGEPSGRSLGGISEAAAAVGEGGLGAWQVLWQIGGVQQQLVFEATQETRGLLQRHTEKWLGNPSSSGPQDDVLSGSPGGQADDQDIEVVIPRHLMPGTLVPKLSDPSALLSPHHLSLLTEALPGRFKGRSWSLLYSMSRHGISLQTLYRKAAGVWPSLLVVQDGGGALFGCFGADPWKVGPRFYGTGETFVFQLQPHAVMFPWKMKSAAKNDFFQYSTTECLAVGGLGRFAIWLDGELARGSSGRCGTFGSPCLASAEEFSIAALEVWGLPL